MDEFSRESLQDTAVADQIASPCRVVLINDEEHTYHYVVEMLVHVCKLSKEQAFRCAVEVDLNGRTNVFRGSRAECEAKKQQIAQYGPDHRLLHSMRSMLAEVEGGVGES
jgi:ATP-dependent Clp protease adaptor protein ClpS